MTSELQKNMILLIFVENRLMFQFFAKNPRMCDFDGMFC